MKYYPAFLDLKNKTVVVVGGGKVAERKVRTLLKAGADIKVVSPELTSGLEKLAGQGKLEHIKRNYRKSDVKDCFVVVAATSAPEVNLKIASDARGLVNVVDAPSGGNFIVPSSVSRGSLNIAISTGGASPAIARAIRKDMEKLYGPEFGKYLCFVELTRKRAIKEISDNNERGGFLKYLASDDILALLRKKGFEKAAEKISSMFERLT